MIRFSMILIVALFARTTFADGPKTPRDIFVAYFKAMEARQTDAGMGLKTPDCADSLHMNIHKLNIVNRLQPFYEYSTSNQALVVAHPFRISSVRDREEAIYAELIKQDGAWRIRKLARTDPKNASWLMQGFRMHEDVKLDLTTEALVGAWQYPCASKVVLKADGTGSHLEVGPGGPAPDQKPEVFTWAIHGTTLIRTFADRKDQRVVTWIDHQTVSFKSASKLYDYSWGRKDPEQKNPKEEQE